MFSRVTKKMSRLKKKLLIYFILIAVVSISVSGEIILELSSPKFRSDFTSNYYELLKANLSAEEYEKVKSSFAAEKLYEPLDGFRNRMILLLLVISASIICSFMLFAKDIVNPMDLIVKATKKITAGDLTVNVPVLSQDEIGQIAELINSMNINLQDVLFRLKQDVDVNIESITQIFSLLNKNINSKTQNSILTNKKMKISEFYSIVKSNQEVKVLLSEMSKNLGTLLKFLDMFNTYSIPGEITQDEIEKTLKHYSVNS